MVITGSLTCTKDIISSFFLPFPATISYFLVGQILEKWSPSVYIDPSSFTLARSSYSASPICTPGRPLCYTCHEKPCVSSHGAFQLSFHYPEAKGTSTSIAFISSFCIPTHHPHSMNRSRTFVFFLRTSQTRPFSPDWTKSSLSYRLLLSNSYCLFKYIHLHVVKLIFSTLNLSRSFPD